MNDFFEGTYTQWRIVRFNRIVKHYGEDFFRGKTLLEVGCAHGDLGFMFSELGADVTCSDGRLVYIETLKKKHPTLKAFCQDLNNGLGTDQFFDIILHTGTLYHLESLEQPLHDACNHCQHLILETIVVDSTDENLVLHITEYDGPDQSLTSKAIRPSLAAVERVLRECNFDYKRITDDLNFNIHQYDWVPKNNGFTDDGSRAFWICERKHI